MVHGRTTEAKMDGIAPNAVQHKLDGILTFVSDPCCGIVFAKPWMGIVFGLFVLPFYHCQ